MASNLDLLLRKRGSVLCLAVLIIGVGFVLRTYALASVPPGLIYDEAFNGLDALRVIRGQQFPIFFEGNAGREPLFIYLQAIALGLFGAQGLALRVVSVWAGVFTIPVVYRLARALAAGRPRANVIGLLAAAGVATSYWHLNFSRLGLRAILLPLLACLGLFFYWRARSHGRTRDWVISGALLGLSLYTYIAARFLPFVYLAFFCTELLARPRGWRDWLKPRALFFLVALVFFAPLGLYFLSEPGAFWGRAQDVALGQNIGVLENAARVAGMFFVRGDLEWRHNLAGRPVLDWITLLPFLAGVLVVFARWKRPAARLMVIWLVMLLLPTVLSQNAPDQLRAIGALPAVYVLVAWGWDALMSGVERFAPRLQTASLFAVLLLALCGSGALTVQDYFFRWANDRHTLADFEEGMTGLANWLNRAEGPIYLPLELYAHPTVQFLTSARFGQITSLAAVDPAELARSGGRAITIDAKTASGAFVVLRKGQAIFLNPAPVPRLKPTESIPGRQRPIAGLAPVSGDPFRIEKPSPMVPLNATFQNNLTLAGYSSTQSSGGRLDLTLYWRADRHPAREFKVFVHLLDENGAVIAQTDELLTNGVSLLDWPLAQLMPDRHVLHTDANVASGNYGLEMGLYDIFNGDRLNVTLADGAEDDRILISPLSLSPQ